MKKNWNACSLHRIATDLLIAVLFSFVISTCILRIFAFASGGGIADAGNGVKENGWLHVKGTQLVNSKGKAIVLHGMSSHGLQWFGAFTTDHAIGATASYGANLFRVAMYTEEGGYLSHKDAMRKELYRAVDAAIARNMYVIIDWHILSDGNPKQHQKEAKAFFKKSASRYNNKPNVIYEICNEPNNAGTWDKIRSYASAVIPVIRKQSPKSLILVGTPTWSQDVDIAANDPLPFPNVMYTCHFYAGTHGQWLRDKITAARKKGLPIFISEWGTSRASGGEGFYKKESDKWIRFMDRNRLSWANWSYCNKNESSAALTVKANAEDGLSKKELTASGRYVFSRF